MISPDIDVRPSMYYTTTVLSELLEVLVEPRDTHGAGVGLIAGAGEMEEFGGGGGCGRGGGSSAPHPEVARGEAVAWGGGKPAVLLRSEDTGAVGGGSVARPTTHPEPFLHDETAVMVGPVPAATPPSARVASVIDPPPGFPRLRVSVVDPPPGFLRLRVSVVGQPPGYPRLRDSLPWGSGAIPMEPTRGTVSPATPPSVGTPTHALHPGYWRRDVGFHVGGDPVILAAKDSDGFEAPVPEPLGLDGGVAYRLPPRDQRERVEEGTAARMGRGYRKIGSRLGVPPPLCRQHVGEGMPECEGTRLEGMPELPSHAPIESPVFVASPTRELDKPMNADGSSPGSSGEKMGSNGLEAKTSTQAAAIGSWGYGSRAVVKGGPMKVEGGSGRTYDEPMYFSGGGAMAATCTGGMVLYETWSSEFAPEVPILVGVYTVEAAAAVPTAAVSTFTIPSVPRMTLDRTARELPSQDGFGEQRSGATPIPEATAFGRTGGYATVASVANIVGGCGGAGRGVDYPRLGVSVEAVEATVVPTCIAGGMYGCWGTSTYFQSSPAPAVPGDITRAIGPSAAALFSPGRAMERAQRMWRPAAGVGAVGSKAGVGVIGSTAAAGRLGDACRAEARAARAATGGRGEYRLWGSAATGATETPTRTVLSLWMRAR